MWVCSVSPPVLPFVVLSSSSSSPLTHPWCSSRGPKALRSDGQQTWACLFTSVFLEFTLIISLHPFIFVPLCNISVFSFDWIRGGEGRALRRSSRWHWAWNLPHDQSCPTPDSPSSVFCAQTGVSSLTCFTPWTRCCRTEPAAVALSWSPNPSGVLLTARAVSCGSAWACAVSYWLCGPLLPPPVGPPNRRKSVRVQRKRSGTDNEGRESQRR